MKHRLITAFLALSLVLPMAHSRTVTSLDKGWTFTRVGDSATPQWQPVAMPHTWNASDGTQPDYYRGQAAYRCHFDAPDGQQGQRTFLHFEGVSQDATVWLNGKRLGRHKGAFTAFNFEVTSLLRRTGNELLVEVTNAPDSLLMPLEGDFTIFGGIYRPVSLLTTPPVCFTPRDHASCGVYVSQTEVSDELATLDVLAKVDVPSGLSPLVQDFAMRTTVIAPDGKRVGEHISQPAEHEAGLSMLRLHQRIAIEHPHLWNGINDPAQYRLRFELLQGGQVVDTLSQSIGIRYFKVDPHRGFFLNGHEFPLRGVNRHQDRDGMGWAITSREHREDMALIQDIGANCIRLAHYPHAQEFYSLCDQTGMLVWAEIPYIGHGTRHHAFDANARQQLTELILQSYNHCSIFCWSLFNELGGNGRPHELVEQLNDLAHQLDPTRLTVAAANNDGRPENDMTDIMAYNTYPGWYWADPATMRWAIDWKYDPKVDRAIGVSEYGAGASIHQHDQHIAKAPKTDGNWHPEEWQALVHEGNYREIAKRPFVWGSFVWNMFDFASASRHEGDRQGINDKGLVTYDRRTRKDAFYFYQANWSKRPMVYITSRRHVERTEATTDVKVYSNCSDVAITVAGRPVEVEKQDLGIFVARGVTLQPGDNKIVATATGAQGAVVDECVWTYNKQ